MTNKILESYIVTDVNNKPFIGQSGMAQGEIESCLTHWSNKYVIQRKEWFSNEN